jgi:molybdopterin/thiamine biosynthesis adenylyltransferase
MINLRSQDIANLDNVEFHIVGCGAIGSSVAMQLVRLGANNFYLYDFDKVEIQNVGVSQYNEQDVGLPKVGALKNHMKRINVLIKIQEYVSKFTNYRGSKEGILILGLDSMKARKDIVESLVDCPDKPKIVIDGRMGAEHYQQYILLNPTYTKYKTIWYPDTEGSEEPCNMKATSYCSNMSGSFIANAVRKIVKKQPYEDFVSFHFPTMSIEKNSCLFK